MARTDIAPALVELGIDAIEAEDIERQIRENRLENAGLDGVHWWAMQRWVLDPVVAVREARLGWWMSPVIDFAYKRLLDARYEVDPDDDEASILVRKPVVTWDSATERFVEDSKSLLPIWQGTLKRAWTEAWRAWPGFSVQPDIPPALPDFSTLKSLIDFYTRVRPHGIDPGHPAHVLRIFLEAIDEAVKGGPGSGYHDPHVGLPGVHGGSQPREGYVWEKIKHGKKPKPTTDKPKTPKEPPKQYPPGTPDSISDAADDEDEAGTPAKRGKPKGARVSKAARVEAKGKVGKAINETLAAIDDVHGDGALGELPFQKSAGRSRWGVYEYGIGGKPYRIAVSDKAATPSMTAAHEIGHWLDGTMLAVASSNSTYFGNLNKPEWKTAVDNFWIAVEQTESIKQLNELRLKGGTVKMEVPVWEWDDSKSPQGTEIRDVPVQGKYVRYLARHDEIWARAYAQYVVTRSSSPVLKDELNRERQFDSYPRQWSDEDFAPVADAIDNLFKTMGWIE